MSVGRVEGEKRKSQKSNPQLSIVPATITDCSRIAAAPGTSFPLPHSLSNAEHQVAVLAATDMPFGKIAATDLAEHVLCAIKDGRPDLLKPQVIGELEHGMDTPLQLTSELSWRFSGCQFLGAKAALAGSAGGLLYAASGAALAAPVAAVGVALLTALTALEGEQREEESAFVQRYGFASKHLLKTSLGTSGGKILSWGFWDLKEGDALFEFVLKSKDTTFQMKMELLHVLIRACGSEMIGAQRLERALERSAEAMGRNQSDNVFAAPVQVLSAAHARVKGFRRSCPQKPPEPKPVASYTIDYKKSPARSYTGGFDPDRLEGSALMCIAHSGLQSKKILPLPTTKPLLTYTKPGFNMLVLDAWEALQKMDRERRIVHLPHFFFYGHNTGSAIRERDF